MKKTTEAKPGPRRKAGKVTDQKTEKGHKEPAQIQPGQQIFTLEEAMSYLRVSRTTLYRLIKSGALTYYELPIGGKRLKKEDLDAVLKLGTLSDVDETDDR